MSAIQENPIEGGHTIGGLTTSRVGKNVFNASPINLKRPDQSSSNPRPPGIFEIAARVAAAARGRG